MSARGGARTRAVRAAVAGAAAAALVAAPLLALAQEETVSPEASPAASPEPISAPVDSESPEAIPPPQTNEFSLGQSLQLRVNANGEPNSSMVDFRWSVNQLTVQGQESGDQEVPVPDRGALLRSLLDFSNPPQEDGIATLTADVQDGYGLARTVSLYPQDEDPPITFEASYTLDGEPVDAWDVVGKSGVLTATYTLTNLSTTTVEVEVEDLSGEMVTVEVEADVPMVGIGKMLIPQEYHGLSLKGGTFGADGRGNNQVQFIALPFRPISKDGTATFGWSANVTDAVIPSMLLQVAPVYLPAHADGDPETVEEAAQRAGLPAPNLDPAVAQIQAGVAQLTEGLQGFAEAGGGPDPLKELEARLNAFFSEFGTNLQNVASTVDPDNPDGAVAGINETLAQLEQAIPAIEELASYAPDVKRLADALTNPDFRADLEFLASNAFQLLCRPAEQTGQVPPGTCAAVQTLATQLLAVDPNNVAAVAGLLAGATSVLIPTLNALQSVLVTLRDQLAALSADLDVIGSGLAERNITLPTLDAVISNVVDQILNSPPGQNVTGGFAQISAGVGDAKSILASYLTTVIVTLQGVGEQAGQTAAEANEAVVAIKAELKGLGVAAQQSPLPYGGDPANAPEGTVLAGAYEFRVDAADTNQPYTPWRILVGLVALLVAGGLSYLVARRSSAEQAEPSESVVPVGATVGGAATAADAADRPATQAEPTVVPEEPVDDETEPGDYVVDESAEEAQEEADAAVAEAPPDGKAAGDAGGPEAGEPSPPTDRG